LLVDDGHKVVGTTSGETNVYKKNMGGTHKCQREFLIGGRSPGPSTEEGGTNMGGGRSLNPTGNTDQHAASYRSDRRGVSRVGEEINEGNPDTNAPGNLETIAGGTDEAACRWNPASVGK